MIRITTTLSYTKTLFNELTELLVDELGEYRLANNSIKPSIAVVPPQIPDTVLIETPGVEVIIYKTPKLVPLPVFSGGVEEIYRVLLIQRDETKSLKNAIELIADKYNNPKIREEQLQEEHPDRGLLLERILVEIDRP